MNAAPSPLATIRATALGYAPRVLQGPGTDRGQLVSTSLLRHGMYTISFDLNTALRFGVPLAVGTRETMGNPVINCYQDSDGRWFWLIGLEGDRHWPDLCRAIDRPDWITDPRFVDGSARRANLHPLAWPQTAQCHGRSAGPYLQRNYAR